MKGTEKDYGINSSKGGSQHFMIMRLLNYYLLWEHRRCAICGCYWNREFAGIGYRSVHYFSEGDMIRFYKYICDRCIGKILISLTRPLKNIFTEDLKTRRLENKIKKINRNIDKLREFNEKRLKLRYGKVTREIKKIKKRLRSIQKYECTLVCWA